MKLDGLDITEQRDRVVVSCRFDTDRRLSFEIDAQYAQWLSPSRYDAFVLAALSLAMQRGEDLEVQGEVSEALCYGLNRQYIGVLALQVPQWSIVRVRAAKLVCDDQRGPGVGTGFSAGVDSFATVFDHLSPQTPGGFRLTHLMFHDVGSHGPGDQRAAQLFHARRIRVQRCAAELGLPLVVIQSNLPQVLAGSFQQTHTLRSAAAVLLLQRLFRVYLYSSAYRYQDTFVGPTHAGGYADPVTLPMLCTDQTRLVASGGQHTRVQKTAQVAEHPVTYGHLNVCVDPRPDAANCSRCWKCCRTMLTLELLGRLDAYEQVFDRSAYDRVRESYVRKLLAQPDESFAREIIEYAGARMLRGMGTAAGS